MIKLVCTRVESRGQEADFEVGEGRNPVTLRGFTEAPTVGVTYLLTPGAPSTAPEAAQEAEQAPQEQEDKPKGKKVGK